MIVPFSPPRIDDKIIQSVNETLKSGWITTGLKTKLLEQKITHYTECQNTLCVNSATSGLFLMLKWFGVTKGDEVIVPAYTYCATANVVIHCGAKPVMVDINPYDYNISLEAIKKAITPNTKVILPVDIGGVPCDYNRIFDLVNQPEIKKMFKPKTQNQKLLQRVLVMSDAAHSLGASYKGRKIGSVADVTVFSFHAVKNLTTAEGGAVCLNLPEPFDNEEVYRYLCILSLHGQSKDAFTKYKTKGWRYDLLEAGYKYNLPDVLAAIGLVEIDRYETETLLKRRKLFDNYTKDFEQFNQIATPQYVGDDFESSYHLYMIQVKDFEEKDRDEVMNEMFNKGIAINVHFIPLPLLSFYKKLKYNIQDFPNTYNQFKSEISLPVFYDMTNEQQQYVVNSIKEIITKVRR